MSYTDATSVKAYCGVSGSADDTLLAALILQADALIDGHADRVLSEADYDEQLNGSGRDQLLLPGYPINSVESVKISAAWDWENVEAMDAAEYSLGKGGILYRRNAVWPVGRQNIRVEFNAGYETIPADLVRAANIIVADLYTRAKQLASGQGQNEMAGEMLGDRKESYVQEGTPDGIPVQAKAILDGYTKLY